MLSPDKRARLVQLLGMLGSAHDGEVLNAARLAQRLIGGEGMTWEEVFAANGKAADPQAVDPVRAYREGYANGHREGHAKGYAEGVALGGGAAAKFKPILSDWQQLAQSFLEDFDLTEWEAGFCQSFVGRRWRTPTDKQRAVFERMCMKFDVELPY